MVIFTFCMLFVTVDACHIRYARFAERESSSL